MAGPISDRFGKRSLSLISSVLLAISLVLIPRLEWGGLLLVAFLAATLAFAFRQGPLQALATELVPRHARGALVAVRNTASQVGIASSTAASGFLYDSLGYGAVGLFSGVITLLGAACIIAMKEPARSVEGGD
jgi:predicted MFS family arabinose efflux permease